MTIEKILDEFLKDEEFRRIFFAHLLNQNGVETGVNTIDLFKKWIKNKTKKERFSFDDGIIWENVGDYSRIEIFPEKAARLLNEQQKHIFCLQSAIQTIDVELQEKGMTKERFEEIKDYWYQKLIEF